jgi:N-acetylmuramoyl-L-alanine amidase
MKFTKSLNIPKLLLFFIVFIFVSTNSDCFENNFGEQKTKIILDPGHGGNDPGGFSISGLTEKDFTLYFAFALKNKLSKNFDVILTRTSDYSMSDIQRTDIANSSNASLFVSLHGGSLFTQKGMKNIFIGYAKKNSDLLKEQNTLFTRLKNEFEKKGSKVNIMNAPFSESNYLTMPFLLIETGNMNSPSESVKMKNPSFIEETAEIIADAINSHLIKKENLFKN